MHLTNYKFEVLAAHAETAVDIFSNFFVEPLFTSSGTGREVQAVDSENSKNLTADGRRRLQILKDLADPEHWYSKFSTGNASTLPTDDPEKLEWIREALLVFHRKHYRPDNMTVVIAGPQPIETLQDWVVSRYSQIAIPTFPLDEESGKMTPVEKLVDQAAKDAPPYTFREVAPKFQSAFRPSLQPSGKWPVLLTTKPLRSMRKLVLMWPLPSDRKNPDRSPSSALSHLLGHEGVGSAFAVLQNHGLLNSLSTGPRTHAPDFNLFQVDMGLTEQGEERWEEVVDLIFAYCRMLHYEASEARSNKNQFWNHNNNKNDDLSRIWGETAQLDRVHFDNSSPGGAYSYAPNIADRVVCYGTEACLSSGSMLQEKEETFPLNDFFEITKLLTPENCIIERCSEAAYEAVSQTEKFPDGFGVQKEKWYGVEYYISPIESRTLSSWKGSGALPSKSMLSDLSLPKPNRYIPRTLDLCPELPEEARKGQRIDKPIEPPLLLVDDRNWRLFHRLDDRYALPQSSMYFLIRTISLQNILMDDGWVFDEKASLLSSLLAGMFNEAMAQETYDADLAGLYWSLSLGASGIKLNCFGFSDRLPDLGLKILSDFLSGCWLKQQYFESCRDRLVRGLRTYFESRRADSHATYYRDALMASKDDGINESLEIALAIGFDEVSTHHQSILKETLPSVDCLFAGNVSAKDASRFFNSARSEVERASMKANGESTQEALIPSGALERQLEPGQEIQLHFASENPEEENGAVLCTYQSSIPSFRGDGISHPLGMKSSSALRLICHMLREPLFDDLRTKQQLGYIVNSWYEIGYSTMSNQDNPVAQTTPVDFLSVSVLSRKIPPPDVLNRIDDFLEVFRQSLVQMPESEILDHANALAEKLRKPIQKLQTEASSRFMRIQRYGPEIFQHPDSGMELHDQPVTQPDMPWDTAESLAATIQTLTRKDLVQTWDRMTHRSTRSRVVSCVYGKTFPLDKGAIPRSGMVTSRPNLFGRATSTKLYTFPAILRYRTNLPAFGSTAPMRSMSTLSTSGGERLLSLTTTLHQHRLVMIGLGVLGAAATIGFSLASSSHRTQKTGTMSR